MSTYASEKWQELYSRWRAGDDTEDMIDLFAHLSRKADSEICTLRKELSDALAQLTAGPDKVLRCAFCGEPYPEGTPTHKSETLAAHIRVCKVHPVGIENRELRADKARLDWMADSYADAGMESAESELEAQTYERAYFAEIKKETPNRIAVRIAVDAALARKAKS